MSYIKKLLIFNFDFFFFRFFLEKGYFLSLLYVMGPIGFFFFFFFLRRIIFKTYCIWWANRPCKLMYLIFKIRERKKRLKKNLWGREDQIPLFTWQIKHHHHSFFSPYSLITFTRKHARATNPTKKNGWQIALHTWQYNGGDILTMLFATLQNITAISQQFKCQKNLNMKKSVMLWR